MKTLASLDNEVIFKKAFTDKFVFESFVNDILGIKVEVDKIETEKRFDPKIGNIDFRLDIFAESVDKRVIIELQRVEYDHNFDRFLHYFLSLIIEQQKSAKQYQIDQTVYAIIIMTEPFTIVDKRDNPVRNEVLLLEVNPKNLLGETINLYGHQFMVLNPNHPEDNTPPQIRDWLDLFYQSVHHSERPVINTNNQGIKRVMDLISFDNLSPEELADMKKQEATRTASFIKERVVVSKIVIGMYKENIPNEMIAKIVQLELTDIERIINEHLKYNYPI